MTDSDSRRATATEKAVAWRLAGVGYSKIASQLEMTIGEVAELVDAELMGMLAEDTSTTARLELARLDALWSAVWKPAARGDQTAVGQALKITAQRAGLLERLDLAPPPVDDNGDRMSVADRLAAIKAAADDPAPVLNIVPDKEVIGDDGTEGR